MATYVNMDHLKFLLKEVHNVEDLLSYDRYADFDMDAIDMLLDSVKTWSDKEAYPCFREMDEDPVRYENGEVYVHPQVGKMMKDAGENGWIGSLFDYDHGGMQMPHMVHLAFNHIIQCANNHLPGYIGLTAGAAALITEYGSQEQIDQYIPHMISGKWGGTMCLTEPQAGSSLSDIVTSGKLLDDGSYAISGQKIFISGGDHPYCDNFVHLTLVRLEGAPAGTKGISLFIVPKFRIEEDGSLVDNDVFTAGDFQKLGQRGYATTHLVFGENDNCKGWLVGQENMGLRYMFQMMNGARIDVGLTAASTATAAYYASLQYALERPQGRKLTKDGKKNVHEEQTLIINHPDVRRMLLKQKAIVEGSLSLLLECTSYSDISHNDSGEKKEDSHLLLEILTPIAKTYPSEQGIESINNGLQILGGYGFTMDFSLQQYYRDIRIMTLYEGTTGIQSLDLLGRKISMNNGRALELLSQKITECISEAMTYDALQPYGKSLAAKLTQVSEVLNHLMPLAMQGNYEKFLADATIFMEMTSTIVIAYQWLKMATVAHQALVSGKTDYAQDFYESKIATMKYFYKYELPHVTACRETIMHADMVTVIEEGKNIFA